MPGAGSLHGRHYDAVVIGAGMSGLAAGIRLRLGEKRCLLLERHEAPGGLNSFYRLEGRRFDVGLHAMTNFVRPEVKGTPLGKIFRQLRIAREEFDLSEQLGSRVVFPGVQLRCTNDFAVLEGEVAEKFPREADGFRQLVDWVRTFDATNLDAGEAPAGPLLEEYIRDPLLRDMLLCPICYYGSAREHGIDLGQFAIMFRSLFLEGFARPLAGVRQVIRVLTRRYAELGGERRMRLGVRRIVAEAGRAAALELDNGEVVTADTVISTIGYPETLRLCSDQEPEAGAEDVGKLSFVEAMRVLARPPRDFGWDDTIVFFNTAERFVYAAPETGRVDPRSGVICFPNNYDYGPGRHLEEGWFRVTAIAHYGRWAELDEPSYRAEKKKWFDVLFQTALSLLPPPPPGAPSLESATVATDMFTPRTITRYTGHLGGAVYGSSRKRKDGTTHLRNLYLAGTDQGFLGIVGAMLSGISIVNRYILSPPSRG